MARTQGTNARAQRLTALVATALLATATAFAIGRVFADHASTYRMAVAGLLSAAVAVALERRGLLLATAVSAIAMLTVVGFMVFPDTTWPDTTWYGLPTPDTLQAMIDAAGMVGEQARVQVAPTEPLKPLMLAALTATWAAVFSAHALAFRAGSPILALLPPIALVAFADTVLEDVVRPLYGVAFLIAAMAMIFADGLRRVQGWGPVWTGPGRDARLSLTAGRGARRVALAAVAFAAVSPLLVPGFGSTAVLDFSSSGDQVRLNPLVSVGARLQRDDPLPVFEVESERPSYWRMVALPDFDGTTWNPDPDPETQELVDDQPLSVNAPAGPDVPVEQLDALFRTTGDLNLPWLPAPYPASTTNLDADGLAWDPEAGAISLDSTLDTGTSYSISAQSVQPTAGQLRVQPTADAFALARYLAFPDDLPPEIEELAGRWTEGVADNTYDQVMAIQDRFTDGKEFKYDDTVQPRDDQDALLTFLTQSRAGFCQQFCELHGDHAAHTGHPLSSGGGLHGRQLRRPRRGAPSHDRSGACVGRGLLPRLRVAHVRSHAGPNRYVRLSLPRPEGLGSMHGSPLQQPRWPRPSERDGCGERRRQHDHPSAEGVRDVAGLPTPARPERCRHLRNCPRVGPLPAGLAGPGDPAPRDPLRADPTGSRAPPEAATAKGRP